MPITRIVRMEFKDNCLEDFHEIFDSNKEHIRNFPGCQHLELHRDSTNQLVRYTLSIWEDEEALNRYRKSTLFGSVWPRTKQLFASKPIAFSLEKMQEIP